MQWLCKIRETKTQMMSRAQSVFDMIFNEETPVITVSMHCKFIIHMLIVPPVGKMFA